MKFKIGDKVVCNKKDLTDSKTDFHCGVEGDMEVAARESYVMTINCILGEEHTTVRLEHKSFSLEGGWWFHPEDLKHHNLSLENK